jgi:hypothetical protein
MPLTEKAATAFMTVAIAGVVAPFKIALRPTGWLGW